MITSICIHKLSSKAIRLQLCLGCRGGIPENLILNGAILDLQMHLANELNSGKIRMNSAISAEHKSP